MRLLGIDFGTKRIGLAVCDELGFTTRGLTVIHRRGGRADVEAVCRVAREQDVEALVMGLPLNMDGSEGRMARLVREFSAKLESELDLPLHLWDERLTSWEAEGILRQSTKARKRKRADGAVDKLAAELILQSYLDANPSKETS